MRYGKNILILTIAMGIALFFYIRNVQQERSDSIQLLFAKPQPGDVYKIRYTDLGGGRSVRYFKVAEIGEDAVFFYRGKLSGWNVSDVFLSEFDISQLLSFSYADLKKIKEGTFNNNEMQNAQLVEIERGKTHLPQNSL
ncbi:MAG: hypothetical protein KF862_27445 [Chitinophagaceae bacterium]|nr:hypothetical protein [Chitinophagaceae bacterium]